MSAEMMSAEARSAEAGAERILVLKLGALGNIVLSLGPFAAIRRHHAGAHITLLTLQAYAGWLADAPWFDAVWVDARPEWWDLRGTLALRRRLAAGRFDRVYDLQTSGRSSRYYRLFPRNAKPEWSGIASDASHPDADPNRNRLHDIDRQFGQLRQAGVTEREPPDLSWTSGDIGRFGIPMPYALLVPGCSPHRPGKRWPAESYGAVAAWLDSQGIVPVIVGSASERSLANTIRAAAPAARDLTGQTTLGDVASLARTARFAVGNDTGPMHLIATAGCRSVVLFSRDSDPALCAPRGADVRVLRRPELAALPPAEVLALLTPAFAV
jgi:ADP-heptose:LPS heptosyltransferase